MPELRAIVENWSPNFLSLSRIRNLGRCPQGVASQQTEQNTPQLERLTHVSITDPAHPLFGQTLEIVRLSSPLGKENLTLLLPNGQHRSVPRRVTDLAEPVSPQEQRRHLAPISIRTILPLSQFVRLRFQAKEEKRDVPSASQVQTDSLSSASQTGVTGDRVTMVTDATSGSTTSSPAVGQTNSTKATDKGATKRE